MEILFAPPAAWPLTIPALLDAMNTITAAPRSIWWRHISLLYSLWWRSSDGGYRWFGMRGRLKSIYCPARNKIGHQNWTLNISKMKNSIRESNSKSHQSIIIDYSPPVVPHLWFLLVMISKGGRGPRSIYSTNKIWIKSAAYPCNKLRHSKRASGYILWLSGSPGRGTARVKGRGLSGLLSHVME